MTLNIASNKSIDDIQQDFSRQYPFLKIEFYLHDRVSTGSAPKKHLQNSLAIKKAGLTRDGAIEINDSMKVGELEKILRTRFGLSAQVSRKSGILWLETTMTDNWTLKQQNDHGKELSEPLPHSNPYKDRFTDDQ